MTDFLDDLAADAAPVRPISPLSFARTYGLGVGTAALIVAATGLRHDFAEWVTMPIMLYKIAATALLAIPAAAYLYLSGRPGGRTKTALPAAALAAVTLFLLPLAVFFAVDASAASAGAGQLVWAQFCVPIIALAAIPVWIASLFWLKRTAPTQPERASWIAGIASGSTAAALFVLHCPFDDLGYVAVWYLAAILLVAGLSRLVMPRLIRW